MADELPLHAQVAQALGCEPRRHVSGPGPEVWYCPCKNAPHGSVCNDEYGGEYGPDCAIPHYDTDWSATGPLIERFGICVNHEPGWWSATTEHWRHEDAAQPYRFARGETPLLAVCLLILALHKTGKLPQNV